MAELPPPPEEPKQKGPGRNALADHDRITMTVAVHQETFGDCPASIQGAYSALLESKEEEPYQKRRMISPEWEPLVPEKCDIETPGMVVVQSRVGARLSVYPTPEEREIMSRQALRVVFSEVPPPHDARGLLIPPKMTLPIPLDPEAIGWIRSDIDVPVPIRIFVMSR